MTADMQLALPARAENVAIVRHALGALGDVCTIDPQTLSDVRLAVTEACTNVVVHAYPDGQEGPMEVTATLMRDELRVVVRDAGGGFDPHAESPGSGLGLPLIASLAESVEIEGDGRGTEVRITFRMGEHPLAGADAKPVPLSVAGEQGAGG